MDTTEEECHQWLSLSVKDINELCIDTFFSPYVRRVVNAYLSDDRQLSDALDADLCLNRSLQDLSDVIALIATVGRVYGQLVDSKDQLLYAPKKVFFIFSFIHDCLNVNLLPGV